MERLCLPAQGGMSVFTPWSGSAAPWQLGNQLRCGLRRVEVPPPPLLSVIGRAVGPGAFRCRKRRNRCAPSGVDSPLIEPKVNSIDPPRVVYAKQPGIVRGGCVDASSRRHRRPETIESCHDIPRRTKKDVRPQSVRLSADSRKRRSGGQAGVSGSHLEGIGRRRRRLTSRSSARKGLLKCRRPGAPSLTGLCPTAIFRMCRSRFNTTLGLH